jgi:SAM-dependent methyltransferase
MAEGYARWWGPVLVPFAHALLDHVAGPLTAGPCHVVDVGSGTGTLALEIVRRWPDARVTALDASRGMLGFLEAGLAAGPETERDRISAVVGLADSLPFEDASFDVAVSSFVLQLVPSRAAALREIRRVLRPGGRIGYLTWLVGGERFAADETYDDVLAELGLEARDDDDGWDDLPSAPAAAAGLRRAGFCDARAEARWLEHAYTPESYADFVEHFDDADRFDELEPRLRTELRARLLARLRALPAEALTLRLPIVYATAERPT